MKCFIYRHAKRSIQSLSAFILLLLSCYAFSENDSCELPSVGFVNGINDQSVEKLTVKAEAGDVESMMALGFIYSLENEDEVEVDYSHAKMLYFYQEAAKRNHPAAFLYLAETYDSEVLFYEEYLQLAHATLRKAELYYIKAVQAGCSSALYSLAMLNYSKFELDKDALKKTVHYLDLATKEQSLIAAYKLFDIYNNKYLPLYDKTAANETLKKALAYKNNLDSDTLEIAKRLFNNGAYIYALQVFNSDKFKNNDKALYYQGYAYYHGQGVVASLPKALEKFQHAAELNNPDATYFLGTLYKNGNDSIIQNNVTANTYFERAAKLGSLDAINELGQNYEEGLGVDIDLESAYNYYYIAAKRYHPLALYNLVMLLSNKKFKNYDLINADYYAKSVYRNTDIEIAKYMFELFDKALLEKDLTKQEILTYSRLRQDWEERLSRK